MNDPSPGTILAYVVLALILIFVIVALVKAVRIVPQAVAIIVERLGRYSRTLESRACTCWCRSSTASASVDLREQVVSFPPQPVITSDNLVVSIDTVIYFQVTEPKSAVYEIANYITAIEQLTVTTLRNVIGSMDLEQTLTSRDQINGQLRGVLDEATGRWGIRVNRVELKSIDPPPSVQGSMEQQMRAERDRRAAILTAEGVKQSQILTAEGEKQAAILRAEGDAQSQILRAEGEARAILQVFDAIHEGDADPKLLAYQYLQMLRRSRTARRASCGSCRRSSPRRSARSPRGSAACRGSTAGSAERGSAEDAEAAEASAEARRERERDRVKFGVRRSPTRRGPRRGAAPGGGGDRRRDELGTRSGLPFDPQTERGQHPGGAGEHHAAAPEPGAATPRPLGGPSQYAPPPPQPIVEDAPTTDQPPTDEPPAGGPPSFSPRH